MGINIEKVYADFVANSEQIFEFPLLDENKNQIPIDKITDIEWEIARFGSELAALPMKSLDKGIEIVGEIAILTLDASETSGLFGKYEQQLTIYGTDFTHNVENLGCILVRKYIE